MEGRLPARVEAAAVMRAVQAEGGFATVVQHGEHDAGTIMFLCCDKGTGSSAWERLPQRDGTRRWSCTRNEDPENPAEFREWMARRGQQDPDLWIVELDIAGAQRFVLSGDRMG